MCFGKVFTRLRISFRFFTFYSPLPFFQITKLNVKLLTEVESVQHYPTSTVTDLLINSEQVSSNSGNRILPVDQKTEPRDSTGDLVDPKSLYYGAIYEVACPHFES